MKKFSVYALGLIFISLLLILNACNNCKNIKAGDISIVDKSSDSVLVGENIELNVQVDNPDECKIDYVWKAKDCKIEPQSGMTNVLCVAPCNEGKTRVIFKIIEKDNPENIILTKSIDLIVVKLLPSDISNNFGPGGWMQAIPPVLTMNQQDYKDKSCSKINFNPSKAKDGWGGIYWLKGKDFNSAKPVNLKGYSKVTFWACAEGEAKVEFIVGFDDKDSFKSTTGIISLEPDWEKYTIDLEGKDLSQIIGGFCWVANKDNNKGKMTFYIVNIQYESGNCE